MMKETKPSQTVGDARECGAQVSGDPRTLSTLARQSIGRYGTIIAAVSVLQFVTYMYLFTLPIFTNHVFPSATLHDLPQYRNVGRWLADAFVWTQGGSGVAPLLMTASVVLQAINGVILARIVGLTRRGDILLVSVSLSLYPAFVDYYTFPVDQLYFVAADTMVLCGVLMWRLWPGSWTTGIGSSALFLAAIACYQPKVALIAFLGLASVLVGMGSDPATVRACAQKAPIRRYVGLITAIAIAGLAYLMSTQFLFQPVSHKRTYTNSISEALSATATAYPLCLRRLLSPVEYLPGVMAWLPPALVSVGVISAFMRARLRGWRCLALAVLAVALMPIALHATHIINKHTWADSGRIISAHAYALALFTGYALNAWSSANWLRAAIGLLCAGLVVTGSQQSNAAAFKTIYDINIMNRILARAEPLLNPAGGAPRALVMCGHEPPFRWSDFVRNVPRGIHLQSNTLAPYRQVLTLNYFAGWTAFRAPSETEIEEALQSMQHRPRWPSEGSIYLLNDTVVVVLQPHKQGAPVTWPGN